MTNPPIFFLANNGQEGTTSERRESMAKAEQLTIENARIEEVLERIKPQKFQELAKQLMVHCPLEDNDIQGSCWIGRQCKLKCPAIVIFDQEGDGQSVAVVSGGWKHLNKYPEDVTKKYT